MSLFRRGETWYASFTKPDGGRIKQSLGTKDKRQAQELHDRLKAELWRVSRLGETPAMTFDNACVRWLEEKAAKKSLDDDKSRIRFWLSHFSGVLLKDITEERIYSAIQKMTNRRHEENWKAKAAAMIKKGKEPPEFKPKMAAVATKATHLSFIKALLRTAERDWKMLEKAPIVKVPQPKNKRIRWLEPVEAQRLIDECPEPLKSVVKFALSTGLRRSNIVNLEWQQIDMQRRVAWIFVSCSRRSGSATTTRSTASSRWQARNARITGEILDREPPPIRAAAASSIRRTVSEESVVMVWLRSFREWRHRSPRVKNTQYTIHKSIQYISYIPYRTYIQTLFFHCQIRNCSLFSLIASSLLELCSRERAA